MESCETTATKKGNRTRLTAGSPDKTIKTCSCASARFFAKTKGIPTHFVLDFPAIAFEPETSVPSQRHRQSVSLKD